MQTAEISYNTNLLIRERIAGKIYRCSCDSNVQVSTQVCSCLPKDLLDSSDLVSDNNQVARRKCKSLFVVERISLLDTNLPAATVFIKDY